MLKTDVKAIIEAFAENPFDALHRIEADPTLLTSTIIEAQQHERTDDRPSPYLPMPIIYQLVRELALAPVPDNIKLATLQNWRVYYEKNMDGGYLRNFFPVLKGTGILSAIPLLVQSGWINRDTVTYGGGIGDLSMPTLEHWAEIQDLTRRGGRKVSHAFFDYAIQHNIAGNDPNFPLAKALLENIKDYTCFNMDAADKAIRKYLAGDGDKAFGFNQRQMQPSEAEVPVLAAMAKILYNYEGTFPAPKNILARPAIRLSQRQEAWREARLAALNNLDTIELQTYAAAGIPWPNKLNARLAAGTLKNAFTKMGLEIHLEPTADGKPGIKILFEPPQS